MKSLAVVSFFGVAVLFGLPVGAQTTAPPLPPMSQPAVPPFQQMPQAQPQEAQPDGLVFPPHDPQDFANEQANEAQPPLPLPAEDDAALGVVAPQPQYDPNNPNLPNAYPPVDLGPDNDIAQTYDDGYDPQAYTQFQDALAPYGSWSDDPTYGNVWSPYAQTVGADFVPYASCGHWIMSEYGWTWVSDWNWGWAPFHYGRWMTIAGRGWSWIPGTMWGPAWVSWRSGHGYVGWSPLPPRGTRLFAGNGGRSPWRFTTAAGLGAAHPSFMSSRYSPSLFARTTVVANDRLLTRGQWTVHVNAGPTRGVTATPVRLATAAPRVLPHVAVYPHAGVSLSARPWMQSGAGHSTGAQGAGQAAGHGPSASNRGAYSQGWSAPAGPQHTAGRTPAYGPAAARPGAGAPATAWSRPPQSYGSAGSYGRPYAAGSYAPAGRPYVAAPNSFAPAPRSYAPAPSYGNPQSTYRAAPSAPASYYHPPAQSYAPAQHSYTPPAAHYGGGNSFGGFAPSSSGGSHFSGGGGGGNHFSGGGGRRR